MSKLVTVYYHIDEKLDPSIYDAGNPDNPAATFTTTSKKFFDKNGHVDDGGGKHYKGINKALNTCGCYDIMESTYELNISEKDLLARMKAKGYELIKNAAFSQFIIDNPDTGE